MKRGLAKTLLLALVLAVIACSSKTDKGEKKGTKDSEVSTDKTVLKPEGKAPAEQTGSNHVFKPRPPLMVSASMCLLAQSADQRFWPIRSPQSLMEVSLVLQH